MRLGLMPIYKLSEKCFFNTDHVCLARFTFTNGSATNVRIMLPVGNEIELGSEHAEALYGVLTNEAQEKGPSHVPPFGRNVSSTPNPQSVKRRRKAAMRRPLPEDDNG
jgi:hypothetical protein